MKKRIVVFGATGNLGKAFINYCIENIDFKKYEIIATGRRSYNFNSKIKYYQFDINKEENLLKKLPKTNIHAIVNFVSIVPAYTPIINEIQMAETNFLSSIKILDYAKNVKADRVLYMHTWAEYAGYWGKRKKLSPKLKRNLVFTGDHAFYAITKAAVVDTMKYYKEEYGIKNYIFILPNIYLYASEKSYYVNGKKKKVGYRYIIDQAIKGKNIELWGDPNSYKDIVYIKDFCQMVYKGLFSKNNGGIYCVGTGVSTSLKKQIEGIIDVFSPINKKSKIILRPDKKNFNSFVMNIDNAIKELGYKPKYDYLSYLEDYKKEMNDNNK